MRLATNLNTGTTVSDAWLRAVTQVNAAVPDRQLYHLVTQIMRPTEQHPEIRAAADWISEQLGYPSIQTVANTIFPAALAAECADHAELADRYAAIYDLIKGLDKGNRRGTYFGRLVDYPSPDGSCNQLADLVRKLRLELASKAPKSARYEINIAHTAEHTDSTDHDQAVPIYAAGRDNSPMGFPCLSFCAFQLDRQTLHMVAHYRRQHLIERGYGNYLGLGCLLGYVADAVGAQPGVLTIVAGVAKVDAAQYRIYELERRAAWTASSTS